MLIGGAIVLKFYVYKISCLLVHPKQQQKPLSFMSKGEEIQVKHDKIIEITYGLQWNSHQCQRGRLLTKSALMSN